MLVSSMTISAFCMVENKCEADVSVMGQGGGVMRRVPSASAAGRAWRSSQ